MEILRGQIWLHFAYLIIQIYQLSLSQDLATHKEVTFDVCTDMLTFVTCTRVFPPGPELSCQPICPEPWTERYWEEFNTVRGYENKIYMGFIATAAWNGIAIICDGDEGRKRVFIRGRPKLSLEFANEVMWNGMNQSSSCVADHPCPQSHFTMVDWIVRCAVQMECAFHVVQRANSSIAVSFNSTEAWNNSVVSCTLRIIGQFISSDMQLSLRRILTVHANPVLTSLPADDFFLEGVNVTLSCFTVEYLPPSVDLVLKWFCVTSCPADVIEYGPGKITFEATSAWDGVLLKCVSEAYMPIKLNSVYRMINVTADAQVFVYLEFNPTLVDEHQLVHCRVIGSYWHISASHPMDMTVVCLGAGCNYTTKQTQSRGYSGKDSGKESGIVSLSFIADSTWNGALVTCKLRYSSLPEHEARLIINIAGKTTTEKFVKEHLTTMESKNSSPSADEDTSFKGLKTSLLALAFGAGAGIVVAVAFISRTFILIFFRKKFRCLAGSVDPSNSSGDEVHSVYQTQSPTSQENLGMFAETTVQ